MSDSYNRSMQLTSPKNLENQTEVVRSQIVKWVFVIYWLLIFEGVLRKWIFPEFHQIIFFIRDPFVLYVYWLALKNKVWPNYSWILNVGFVLTGLGTLLTFIQIIAAGNSLVFAAYGWRNYFLYIPLAIVVGNQFQAEDFNRLIKQTLCISIPIAVLTFIQAISPADAVINSGISGEYAFTPLGVTDNIVRTQGTFTSILGQSLFIGSLVAMALATWILPDNLRPLKGKLLYIATASTAANLAVSGSRMAFTLSFITLFVFCITGFLLFRSSKLAQKALWITVAIIAIGVFVIPIFFADILNALLERAIGAAQLNDKDAIGLDVFDRILGTFTSFMDMLPHVPLLGYGMGLGGNARERLGINLPIEIEDEWPRNIVELGPILGIVFILFRIAIVGWLFNKAMRSSLASKTLLPVLLATFTIIILLNGHLTGAGTANGYGWLFMGFSLAACRIAEPLTKKVKKAKKVLKYLN